MRSLLGVAGDSALRKRLLQFSNLCLGEGVAGGVGCGILRFSKSQSFSGGIGETGGIEVRII